MEKARPDERVALAAAMLIIWRRRFGFDGRCLNLHFGEALGDHCAEYVGAVRDGTIDAGFMSELEAHALALDPANRAFDRAVFAEVQVNSIPQHRLEIAFDHGSAARQVH